MSPEELIIRCYGYKTSRGTWVLKCIDLDLVVEEDSVEDCKKAMDEAIRGYISAVLDTEDKDSIPALLRRKAPLKDRLVYHFSNIQNRICHSSKRLKMDHALRFQLLAA